MCNIGILGGTFDPIHNGHIMLAKKAYEYFNLDKVLIMVTKKPPHKKGRVITEDFHRVNMIKLAIRSYPYMDFSDFEMQREGYIYTADTLTLLKKAHPDNNYFFIIGGDSLRDFHTWYHPEIVINKATILAAVRDDISNESFDNIVSQLNDTYKEYKPDIRKLITTPVDISSSEIRSEINRNNSISKYLDKDVYDYILKNKLYDKP